MKQSTLSILFIFTVLITLSIAQINLKTLSNAIVEDFEGNFGK